MGAEKVDVYDSKEWVREMMGKPKSWLVDYLRSTLNSSAPSASTNTGSLHCPFLLVERFADNGAHSHWELIDCSTGAVEWSQQASA